MKAHLTTRLLTIAAAILLCAGVPAADAQQAASVHPSTDTRSAAPLPALSPASAAKTAAAAEEMKSSEKAKGEGIRVHGHWVLELKSPDGKLLERREFDNSLVTGGNSTSGDQALAALLAGDASSGGLAVGLISGPAGTAGIDTSSFCNFTGFYDGNPLYVPAPAGITCVVLLPTHGYVTILGPSSPQVLSTVVSFSPTVSIQLSGNWTVSVISSISAVQTIVGLCTPVGSNLFPPRFTGTAASVLAPTSPIYCTGASPNSDPAQAGNNENATLTSTIVPGGPLAVTANQVVTVTVTLTFS